MLTIHLYPVLRLRMNGTLPALILIQDLKLRPKYAGVSRTAAVGELPVFLIIIRVLGIQDGVELNLRVV